MKASLLTFLIGLNSLTGQRALGAECSCASGATAGEETIVEADSLNGNHLTARFAADPVNLATKSATLCTKTAARVGEAKLWMPEMGHGSSPTRLVVGSSTCTIIQRINFLMEGDWEIRVKLDDNDSGTLVVGVAP